MTTLLTRRRFVVRGGAALTALAFPALGAARKLAPKTQAVYKLDPRSEGCGGGVGSCKACVAHDEHSLFPTAKAADGNRAHAHCDCCVVVGTLEYGTYVALFGNPKHLAHYRADTRDHRSQALLKKHPPSFPS